MPCKPLQEAEKGTRLRVGPASVAIAWAERFVPPDVHDPTLRVWARFIAVLALLGVPFWAAFAGWYLFVIEAPDAAAVLIGAGLAGTLVPFFLRWTGSVKLAAHLLAGMGFVALTWMAILRGGFPVPVLMWLLVIPVGAAMQRVIPSLVVVWGTVCVLEFCIFAALALSGHAPVGTFELTAGQQIFEELNGLLSILALFLLIARATGRVTQQFSEERSTYQKALIQSQKLEALGHLVGGIAHDFNNAVLVATCGIETAREQLEDEHPAAEDLADAAAAMELAESLTRQLLRFGRKESKQALDTPLEPNVARIEKMLRRILGAEIRLRVVVRTVGATVVHIAPQQLDQVILNLAVNARDAMPGGGQITLLVDASSTHAFVDIIDTGCGIPDDIVDQIFEPFFTTKDEERGTGLGMWICRTIVDDVGGSLSIVSTSRKGTTIRVSLVRDQQRNDVMTRENDVMTREKEPPQRRVSLEVSVAS